MSEHGPGLATVRRRRPHHVVVAMVLATLVVVGIPVLRAAWPAPPPSVQMLASHDAFRPTAGDGPFLAELAIRPEGRVVVERVALEVVGDGHAEPVVCEWADGPPAAFGLEPEGVSAVTSGCAEVRALAGGEEVGAHVERSLMLRFEATGPDDPTLCSLTASLRAPGSGSEVTVWEEPIGIAIRDGGFAAPMDPFDGCPDPPQP